MSKFPRKISRIFMKCPVCPKIAGVLTKIYISEKYLKNSKKDVMCYVIEYN